MSEHKSFLLEVTTSRIVGFCVTLFAIAVLLVATMMTSVYLGYHLKGSEKKVPLAPSIPAVQKSQKVTMSSELGARIKGLEVAVKAQGESMALQSREFSELKTQLSTINEAIDEKVGLVKKEILVETREILRALVSDVKTASEGSMKGIESVVGKVVESKLASIQLEDAAGEEQSQLILTQFETLKDDIKNLKVRFVEMTAIWKMVEKYGSRIPDAKRAKTELSPQQKVAKLQDYAEAFITLYERAHEGISKKWDNKWKTSLNARNGNANRAANERLLMSMAKLKDKKKEEIEQGEVYEACKTLSKYRELKLAYPTAFGQILTAKDQKSYQGIVDFIEQAIQEVR